MKGEVGRECFLTSILPALCNPGVGADLYLLTKIYRTFISCKAKCEVKGLLNKTGQTTTTESLVTTLKELKDIPIKMHGGV